MRSKTITIVVLTIGVLSVWTSCRHRSKTTATDAEVLSRTKEDLESHVQKLTQYGTVFEKEVKGLRDILTSLEEWGASYVTTVPNPCFVSVTRPRGGLYGLIVYYLERDTDIVGVHVREYWPGGEAMSETYELPIRARDMLYCPGAYLSWRTGICFVTTERETPSVRKDEVTWERWVSSDIYGTSQPPFYLAKPSEKVHVLISLIDQIGHESRAVSLSPWVDD